MRKSCRSRVRSRGKLVLTPYTRMVALFGFVQDSLRWREWTFTTVSLRQAELLVSVGEAQAVTGMKDGVVQVVGYRALLPLGASRPSPATLTFATMVAVGRAAQGCPLSRRERLEVEKMRVWPLIGDTKAPAVRPRISDEDRRAAEKLLGVRPVAGLPIGETTASAVRPRIKLLGVSSIAVPVAELLAA